MERRKRAGNYGEAAAKGYLAALGYDILETRYRCDGGEIDIIAKDGEYLVFVEVKYRRQVNFGSPAAAVTASKQRAMATAAWFYLAKNNLADASCRFDIIEVFGRENLDINHIKDAFWAE